MSSLLVRIFGFPATLIHGDTLVLDRWLWLRNRLPNVSKGEKRLLDVGCGTGAFTIGAARRGYYSLGLSWDLRNQEVARQRATICKADEAAFEVCDVRDLDARTDLLASFDVILCCENIEHILNDQKLVNDMTRCLRPGGTLLLTTPNYNYVPITRADNGPFSTTENGWHVRRGYTEADLRRLCERADIEVLEIGFCSGFTSQKITWLMRAGTRLHPLLGWALVLPLRLVPVLIDSVIARLTRWPGFSITLIARKPVSE
jgi:2-polyprenyl-3-methyl-5-hydroxy-6-metoxy-1,4-benzoquinol methylase